MSPELSNVPKAAPPAPAVAAPAAPVADPPAEPTPAPVSPAGSAVGYSLRVWLARNKNYLKALLSIVGALATAFLPQIKDTNLSIAAGGAVGILVKMGLDWIDFYFSAVPLSSDPLLPTAPVPASSVAAALRGQNG